MNIDIEKLTTKEDVVTDFENVMEKLVQSGELYLFQNNRPRCVLISMEQYEKLVEQEPNATSENKSIDDVLQTLNKIGKQIFVDYYYIFKEDYSPEEELPEEFTLNSRRSRTSSARKLFREKKNIRALEIIINSDRMDDDIIEKAKVIYQNEIIDSKTKNLIFEDDNLIEDICGNKFIKIGKFVKNTLIDLFRENKITREEIEKMTTLEYSKKVFNMNFSVLKEVNNSISIDLQKKDSKGYNRYYNFTISAYGKRYLLCSQWVENLHRSSFNKWLELRK